MSTPGRRRALKALHATRRRNVARVKKGQRAIVGKTKSGKPKTIAPSTYRAKYGMPKKR